MFRDHDQAIAYHLAGTVNLPAPFPAKGKLSLVAASADAPVADIQVRISHRINYKLKIIRYVSLRDVRAILAREAAWVAPTGRRKRPHGRRSSPWAVLIHAEVVARARARLRAHRHERHRELPWLSKAIVYVPEAAPVLMRAEVGLTAAESAEYYPPLAGGPRGTPFSHPSVEKAKGPSDFCLEAERRGPSWFCFDEEGDGPSSSCKS